VKSSDATELLANLREGDSGAVDELFALVYRQLHTLARGCMDHERANHTLQPTALVHETYLRLIGQNEVDWQSRAHFLGVAARAMRQILINHAVARRRRKRTAPGPRVPLDAVVELFEQRSGDLIGLHEALERLAKLDEQQSRIVELRFFGGLGVRETGEVLGISERTVRRAWQVARVWLKRELADAPLSGESA